MACTVDTHSARHRGPTLSLIVAAYNIATFIAPCLQSILACDTTDYEVLVIDDGSTDDTLARIEPFRNHPAVRIISQENGGLGAARNAGLDAASGDYIMFVDGDDWLAPKAVDTCVQAISAAPDTDLFVFDYVDILENDTRLRRCTPDFWGTKNAAWNKIYARTLIGDERFDTDILYEDFARVRPWVAKAARQRHIDRALYYYRNERPGSIMNSRDISRFFELFTAAERCVARIDECRPGEPDPDERLGPDWRRHLYTSDVFVPGIIYWTARIDDSARRRRYIAEFMAAIPVNDVPDLARLTREFGAKIALIALCYSRGAYRAGDFLLFDTVRYKRRVLRRIGRGPS